MSHVHVLLSFLTGRPEHCEQLLFGRHQDPLPASLTRFVQSEYGWRRLDELQPIASHVFMLFHRFLLRDTYRYVYSTTVHGLAITRVKY